MQKSPGYLAILLVIMAICPLCRHQETVSDNTKDYYAGHLAWAGAGQVYRYRPVKDPALPDEVWHYRLIPDWRATFVRASQYDEDGHVIQKRTERIGVSGAELISMDVLFVTRDTVFTVTPGIHDSSTFEFTTIPDKRKSHLKIEYWDSTADSVRVVLTKERTLQSKSEFEFQGKTYPAIEITVDEVLETETEGFTTTTWSGTEIYAQGLGLVYYKKTISEELSLEYVLAEVIPFGQFNLKHETDSIPGI